MIERARPRGGRGGAIYMFLSRLARTPTRAAIGHSPHPTHLEVESSTVDARDARAGRPELDPCTGPRRATALQLLYTPLSASPAPPRAPSDRGAARGRAPGTSCVCDKTRASRAREAAGIKYIKAQRPQARTGHATTMHRGKHFYMSTCATLCGRCVWARAMPPVTLRVGPDGILCRRLRCA